MRIVAGEFRGRRLQSPPDGATTRPMPDLVKQALFNLLRGHCEGARVLDAFCGTGVIGLEAVSRGAVRCVLVERDRRVVRVLEENIQTLGAGGRCEVVAGDALGPATLARCPSPVDLIFFDPPYELVRSEAGWQRVRTQFVRLTERLSPTGFAVLRTPWPFVHTPGAPANDEDEPAPAIKPRKASKREDWRRQLDRPAPVGTRSRRAAAQPDPEPEPEAPATPVLPPVEVELTMPGVHGPETHVYRHTAVHLYAKRTEPPRSAD